MPCNNITEQLVLKIQNNKIIDYSLNKISCGISVGNILKNWLTTINCDQIVNLKQKDFLDLYLQFFKNSDKDFFINRFLLLKHFNSIQNVLKMWYGLEDFDKCFIKSINYFEDHLEIIADVYIIGIDPLENPGCSTSCLKGGCGKCNSK